VSLCPRGNQSGVGAQVHPRARTTSKIDLVCGFNTLHYATKMHENIPLRDEKTQKLLEKGLTSF